MYFRDGTTITNTDQLDLLFKAANLSGYLEAKKTITVHDWELLEQCVMYALDDYLDSDDGDFFDMIEAALIKEFPPEA